MASPEQVLLGRIPKTLPLPGKHLEERLDGDLYSLHHFLRLATQGQTVAIDMLFAPASQIEMGPLGHIWDDIRFNREKLLSRQMHAFTGYARNQAAKYSLKGDRLNKLEEFLDALSGDTIDDCWDALVRDDERINPHGIRELQIAGKWFGSTTRIEFVKQAVNKIIKKYGERAHAAADAAGVDWKAMSHAVRVIEELKEILQTRNLVFPLRVAPRLLAIKTGQVPLEEVQSQIDVGLIELDALMAASSLPEKVDFQFWDDFLMNAVRSTL